MLEIKVGDKLIVGSSLVTVTEELIQAFEPGDRLLGVPETGEILHLKSSDIEVSSCAVDAAVSAFKELSKCDQTNISNFYRVFADRLADDETFANIKSANEQDVESAERRNRSTSRLLLTEAMRRDMIDALGIWETSASSIGAVTELVAQDGLEIQVVKSPLGVVAFIFEGRPNVFADATGVLRSGNSVVFRIGSDALGTARAIMKHAVEPAMLASGLPSGSVSLVDSPSHGSGWALFSDSRIALAVARGSGSAVRQLGAIARQSGIAVSLHGTGGAWMIIDHSAPAHRVRSVIGNSLDRKVCNTLNVLCIVKDALPLHAKVVAEALSESGAKRKTNTKVHLIGDVGLLKDELLRVDCEIANDEFSSLATEWEWDNVPELSVIVVDSVAEAVTLFNEYSPSFILSLISDNSDNHEYVWNIANAPFVGDGFTRWVDGQFALSRPELGLSNWEVGRLLGRSGVLSGDSVYTLRLKAIQTKDDLHR